MNSLRSTACWIALGCALSFAVPAQARDTYDCAAIGYTPESSWDLTETQGEQLYTDLDSAFPDHSNFMIRSCGVIESGKRLIVVGALHIVGDEASCDDEKNFGVLYDPETRKFSDVMPRQKLCANGMRIKRPQQ